MDRKPSLSDMKSEYGSLGHSRLSPLSMEKDVMSGNKLMSSDEGIPLPANKPKIWSLADTAACKTPPPNVTAGQTQWLGGQGYSQPLPASFASSQMYNRYSNLFNNPMPSSAPVHNPAALQTSPLQGSEVVNSSYSNASLSSCASAAMGSYHDSVNTDTPPQTPPTVNTNMYPNSNNNQMSSPDTSFRPIYKTQNSQYISGR